MRTQDQIAADYQEFRGKCLELCNAAIAADPTLTLVRGHVFVPGWGTTEPHWWTVRNDGTIYDPSVRQFPIKPHESLYEPFSGFVECCQCGKPEISESDAIIYSNYCFCSDICIMRFVGI